MKNTEACSGKPVPAAVGPSSLAERIRVASREKKMIGDISGCWRKRDEDDAGT